MSFRHLAIGDVFVFSSEYNPFNGLVRGPWRKISPRKYQSHEHATHDMTCQVGTIGVFVSPLEAYNR